MPLEEDGGTAADGVAQAGSDSAVVESACLSCGENGTTRLLLTRIPHFRGAAFGGGESHRCIEIHYVSDVILMSFECGHCGYRDNELQDAAPLQDFGVRLTARVLGAHGLSSQVVLSGTASARIDELDFEVQPTAQKGRVTTVEGYLLTLSTSLDEHIRSIVDAMAGGAGGLSIQLSTGEVRDAGEYIHALSGIKDTLLGYISGAERFTLVIDDPAGNSYIEESAAISVSREEYLRSEDQQKRMGYAVKDDFKKELDLTAPLEDDADVGKEGVSLPVDCPHCGCEGRNQICEVLVPGFGPCIIMAFTCDTCGAKSNEMKPGGGYKECGRRWTLSVEGAPDLNRDVIISETATVRIAHLDFEMSPGTIGGAFTTVEGLLEKLVEGLEKAHPFVIGDSAPELHHALRHKVQQLRKLACAGAPEFMLVIDDPADHSFIGARRSSSGADAHLASERYTRSREQDEELGLTDMKTEDY